MKLQKALTYLDNVTKKSMAVPMRRYAGSTGRTAQGKCPREIFTRWIRLVATVSRGYVGGNWSDIDEYFDGVDVQKALCVDLWGVLWAFRGDTVAAKNSLWDRAVEQID